MKHILLIACVSKKQSTTCKARDLYISPLFKKNLTYALSLNADQVFILSAKYGLVGLDEIIEPYEQTLYSMSVHTVRAWANRVLIQLGQHANLSSDFFILLAGQNYRKYLVPKIKNYEIPFEGLRIGEHLQRLTQLIGRQS